MKNLQRQNIKLESSFKDKDKLIGDLRKEVSELKKEVVACRQSVQDMEDQIKKSAEMIELEINKS